MKLTQLLPLLFLYACATVVHPTGGPKDETPPQIVKSTPDSNQTNFTERELVFRFDEFVEIKDPNAFVISPPSKENPKISLKGRSLIIKFKEDLSPNTTYIVQLNGLVQDITEKNILNNQEFRFSTGPEIDTLSIHGYVYDHITHEPLKDISIALFYSDIASYPDSAIYPLYISRCNSDGSFKIDGLRADTFSIYAFKDINFNNKFETGEKFAYLETKVNPLDSNVYKLYLANNENLKDISIGSPIIRDYHTFYLPVKQNSPGKIQIRSSLPSYDKTQKIYTQYIHPDTLLIYDSYKSYSDTLLNYYISFNDSAIDTLKLDFPTTHVIDYRIPAIQKNTLEPHDTLTIKYFSPLLKTQPSKIHLFKDSVEIKNVVIANALYESYVLFQPESQSNYKLVLEDSAYTTLDHIKSGNDTISFSTPDYSKYGDIQIKWKGEENNIYKIELLNNKEKAPEYIAYSNQDSITFLGIPAGTYYARISLYNQKSTTHVIPFKTQAIPYYYYDKTLELRGSWTLKDIFINIKQD